MSKPEKYIEKAQFKDGKSTRSLIFLIKSTETDVKRKNIIEDWCQLSELKISMFFSFKVLMIHNKSLF